MKHVLVIALLCLATFCSAQKPNVVWLTVEDISPLLSMYGDSTANTPNLDRLASESKIFTNAYSTVGVCGPSRSSLITGMYPASIGTHNMRTGKDIIGWGGRRYDGNSNSIDINGEPVPHYSAVIPPQVKCFSEYLRKAGYYCTNNPKTDYQFAAPVTAWDENGPNAHWRNREEDQPFFAVFNYNITHESQVWKQADEPLTVDPKEVPVPSYFPDNEVIRNDIARVYSNIEIMDRQVGERLKELEEAGLMDNTIIFFFSDHGGPLPRGKREHYPSGLQVPMMIRLPDNLEQEFVNDMISFVDFAPTVLSLSETKVPDHLQGKAFLGKEKETMPEFIYGTGDRFDEHADRTRSVISKDYVHVRNYYPELPAYKDNGYRKNIAMMNEILEQKEKGQLNADQEYWFRQTKASEEFYSRVDDPHCLKNLIKRRKFKSEIKRMQLALDKWEADVKDKGAIPEKELFLSMWPEGNQPKTERPVINELGNAISLTCSTKGASIAYIITDGPIEPNLDSGWKVYQKPVNVKLGQYLYAMSTRIGFEDSEVVVFY